jgi:hypothetical protein
MKTSLFNLILAGILALTNARAADIPPAEVSAIAREVYIYGFPFVEGYKTL